MQTLGVSLQSQESWIVSGTLRAQVAWWKLLITFAAFYKKTKPNINRAGYFFHKPLSYFKTTIWFSFAKVHITNVQLSILVCHTRVSSAMLHPKLSKISSWPGRTKKLQSENNFYSTWGQDQKFSRNSSMQGYAYNISGLSDNKKNIFVENN